jgi:hypothetical protein
MRPAGPDKMMPVRAGPGQMMTSGKRDIIRLLVPRLAGLRGERADHRLFAVN